MADMEHKAGKTRSGLTLIEVMLAVCVIVVGVLGAMMFRYYSALDARKADIQVGAGRVALLILEGWKGAAGKAGYDPKGVGGIGPEVLSSPDISISGTYPYYTVKLTKLTSGTDAYHTSYSVTLTRLDGVTHDINGDGSNDPCLVKLTVAVASSVRDVNLSDFVRN